MARTTVSARLFNVALQEISKNIVVKNNYLASLFNIDTDYIYVDKYESAARSLLTKYSLTFLTASMDQVDQLQYQISFWNSQIVKLQNGESINNMPYPTVDESIEYFEKLIEDAENEIENIITINNTADESTRAYMRTLVNYKELNDYYLMLDGKPPHDSDDSYRVFVYNEDYNEVLPIDEQSYADKNRWLSSSDGIKFLEEHKSDKKFKYLQYMTTKKIRPFIARLSKRFEILYCPISDPQVLSEDFITIYNMALDYVVRIYYSEGYRNTSEAHLYEGFIGMCILFMAIAEMHYKYLDADISRDFYDLDSLKIVYEAYGVPFYDIIPLKYHKKIVKNINRLIKYKGSNKVFFELCDIFDYDILGIYQYYLFKERKMDKNGDPIAKWLTTDGNDVTFDDDGKPTNLPLDEHGNPIWEPDLENMYDIYFVKSNIDKDTYTQILDPNNKVNYDSIVTPDSYWFQFDPDTIKTIYEKEYNYIETKYIGVQLMFNMTDLLWESLYFLGMLRDNRYKIDKPQFKVSHERLGAEVPIFDMLIYIIALICKKRGYTGEIRGLFYKVDEDGNYLDESGNITTDPNNYVALPSLASRILGFNFKGLLKGMDAILSTYSSEISYREKTMQGLHIKKDFNEGENFHPFDIEVGNDFFHGNDIQDWIKKNKGFFKSEEARNLFSRIFANKGSSTAEAETAYFENLNITSMEDISRAFKAMKNMKMDIDTLLYNTHDRDEYNALRDLQRLLYTTEVVLEVFKDDMTGELAITYYDLLESLNPQLANRYNDENIEINDELDYCLLQLQELCDELRYMIYIDQLDIDIITEYLYKMLYFFKSAKADLTEFNIIFYINDRAENCLKFLERLYLIETNIWIDDKFDDLYDHIEKCLANDKIYDREFVFNFTMLALNDLTSKRFIIDDGWDINNFLNYAILESSEENPIDIDTIKKEYTQNFVVSYIKNTESLPDQIYNDINKIKPCMIKNIVLENGDIEQVILVANKRYTRYYNKNTGWSQFKLYTTNFSVYFNDRLGELKTYIKDKAMHPLVDKFANVGMYDFPKTIGIKNIEKDGFFIKDTIFKIQ